MWLTGGLPGKRIHRDLGVMCSTRTFAFWVDQRHLDTVWACSEKNLPNLQNEWSLSFFPWLFAYTKCQIFGSVIDLYLMVGIGGYGRENLGVQGPLAFHVFCFCSMVHGSPWHWATAHILTCVLHTFRYLLFNSHHKLTEWKYHWLTQMMSSKWGTCHSSGLWSACEIKMGESKSISSVYFCLCWSWVRFMPLVDIQVLY